MRAHIRWVFFEIEKLGELIKNDENNENWPSTQCFGGMVVDYWWKIIEFQQEEINSLEIKNNKTRQLMADVQTWFINEYNLLGKPAKRNLLEKERELRQLERELKVNQYNLDHPKQELEEYEKQCLLRKIEIGKRKIGNKKDEVEKAKEATENEKRELCERIAYSREDLEPFLEEPVRWQIGQIQQLLNSVIGENVQPKNSFGYYSAWWKKYRDIDPPAHVDAPLVKLWGCIERWKEHNKGEEPEPNPYEIYVEEKTDDSLIFVWKPVEQVIGKDKDGNKIKGVFGSVMKNYLFNYYGEWYEVSDYQQINYNLMAVSCQKSVFYNDYWSLNLCSANVILHHSPLSHEEICSCPNSELYTSWKDFDCDYELNLDFYRLGKSESKERVQVKDSDDPSISYIYGGKPKKVDIDAEWSKITGFWQALGETFTGMEGILYFFFGSRLGKGSMSTEIFGRPNIEKWPLTKGPRRLRDESISKRLTENSMTPFSFKKVGDWDEKRKISSLTNDTDEIWLEEEGLLDDEMYHFYKFHVEATLFWRKKPIWKGPYWILSSNMRVTEVITAAGNEVIIEGSDFILCRIRELVTCKLGGDNATSGFLNSIITVGTVVATAAAPGLVGATGIIAKTAVKAGAVLAGGMAQQAANKLFNGLPYEESTQTMSIHEFKSKFLHSKNRPISMRISFSRELANQYRNRRELKGQMLYTYTNLKHFGTVLSQANHFLKASVISWNMTQNSEWWRSKIESGVYIYGADHNNFYNRKLTKSKMATICGGITRGSWNEVVIEEVTNLVRKTLMKANIKKADYSSEDYIASPNSALWNQMEGQLNGSHHREHNSYAYRTFRDQHLCLGCLCGGGSDEKADYRYNSRMKLTVGGTIELKTRASATQTCTVPIDGGTVVFEAEGNDAIIFVEYQEKSSRTIKNPISNPSGIPPSERLPNDPSQINEKPSTPFNPNQFPSSGNLIPNPTGSGEVEIRIPVPDVSPDPDFDPGADPDLGQDPDPGADPDPSGDPDPGQDPDDNPEDD